jgi:MYXO-CTERM domain-containing protein
LDRKSKFKSLAKTLLATTCLTAATAAAGTAGTVDESQIDGGFGAAFNTATLLAGGTTTVTGQLCGDCSNLDDFFAIPGLTPGHIIQVTASVTDPFFQGPSQLPQGSQLQQSNGLALPQLGVDLFDSSNGAVGSPVTVDTLGPQVFTVTAPGDGKLIFDAGDIEDFGCCLNYTISITDQGSAAPEPGTTALGALGLAAAATLRRKLKKA